MTNALMPGSNVHPADYMAETKRLQAEAELHYGTTNQLDDAKESAVFSRYKKIVLYAPSHAGEAAYQLALMCRSYYCGRPFSKQIGNEISPDIGSATESWFQCALDNLYIKAIAPYANFIRYHNPTRADELDLLGAQSKDWRGITNIIYAGLNNRGTLANNGAEILKWTRRLNYSDAPEDVKEQVINSTVQQITQNPHTMMARDFIRAAMTVSLKGPDTKIVTFNQDIAAPNHPETNKPDLSKR